MKKRILSLLLAVVMVVGLLPGFSLTANAASGISYLDANGNAQTHDATEVTANDSTWSSGWYVVNEDITISGRVTVSGAVYLILADGKTLNAEQGITVSSGNSLTIYAQSKGDGMGALTATSRTGAAAIGGNNEDGKYAGGTIIINGGAITATNTSGAGIGGSG